MANETKVGVAVFVVLVGVFGFVLHRKYEDKLTALAALHGPDDAAGENAEQAADPLDEKSAGGLGTVTDAQQTDDLADFGDAFGQEPGKNSAAGKAVADAGSDEDPWGAEQGGAVEFVAMEEPAPAKPAEPKADAVEVAATDDPFGSELDTFDSVPAAAPAEAPEAAVMQTAPVEFVAEETADLDAEATMVAEANGNESAPVAKEPAPADADLENAWPADMAPTETPEAATVAAAEPTAAEDTEKPADSAAFDEAAIDFWGGATAAAEPTVVADAPGSAAATKPAAEPAAADPLFPDDTSAGAEMAAAEPAQAAEFDGASAEILFEVDDAEAADAPALAENAAVAEAPATLEESSETAATFDAASESVELAMDDAATLDGTVTLDEPAAPKSAGAASTADDDALFLAADEAPAATAPPATKSAQPKADAFADAVAFPAEDLLAADDAPADMAPSSADNTFAEAADDTFAEEDMFAAAETPAAPADPAPTAASEKGEAAVLWGAEEPTTPSTPAAANVAKTTPAPADDHAGLFLDATEPPAATAVAPQELAAAEESPFEEPPMMEPTPESDAAPTMELAPVELADSPAAETPAAPAMNEWPDLTAPPSAAPTPKPQPNPAASLAAEEPESGLTPVNFAPDVNTQSRDLASRPVRNADAQTPVPFRFSSANDRKVYEVQDGESYWVISKQAYGAAKYFKALARYNALRIRDPRNLKAGMKVICPPPSVLLAYDTDLAEAERAAESSSNPGWRGYGVDERGRPVFMVGTGDTLGAIAQTHLGRASRAEEIFVLNRDKIRDPRRLKPGTLLNLPTDAAGVRRRDGAMR